MKALISKILSRFGYQIRRTSSMQPAPPGTEKRPVGDMQSTLADFKARGLRCTHIMDIGANRAGWSQLAKQVYTDTKFCLIEPQQELENFLKIFCNESNGSIYFLAGAGAQPEKKYLTIWDDMEGSSLLPQEDEQLKGTGKQREINIITIDELISTGKFPIPELIKLDIQGYELEALKGSSQLFGKTEVFILETSLFPFEDVPGMPVFHEVVNFMAERGYVVYDFAGFLRRPYDGALGQCDICFVKKDGFLHSNSQW